MDRGYRIIGFLSVTKDCRSHRKRNQLEKATVQHRNKAQEWLSQRNKVNLNPML